MAGEVVPGLKLGEEAGRNPRAHHQLAGIGIALPGQHPHQLALARAVGPDDPYAFAEVDLVENGRDEVGDLQRAQVEHSPGRVAAADAHGDVVSVTGDGRRPGGAEPVPARLGGVGRLAQSLEYRARSLNVFISRNSGAPRRASA